MSFEIPTDFLSIYLDAITLRFGGVVQSHAKRKERHIFRGCHHSFSPLP